MIAAAHPRNEGGKEQERHDGEKRRADDGREDGHERPEHHANQARELFLELGGEELRATVEQPDDAIDQRLHGIEYAFRGPRRSR